MSSDDDYAFLGMYDFPSLRPAQDAWWAGLARHFRDQGLPGVPDQLNWSITDPYDIWQAPNMFFAQTCGYPLTRRLAGKVQLVGTPCYDAPGCLSALYRSLFVVHEDAEFDDLSSAFPARVAVNSKDSYSGWWALKGALAALGLDDDPFSDIIISGGHANSIDLVRERTADLAAIDCVTHALIGDVEPDRLAGTRVLARSAAAPGLPYITRAGMSEADTQRMATAIRLAFDDLDLAEARRTLRLTGFSAVPPQQYVLSMS